ncbi:MAG: ATP-binding protein [Akkermansia sp.]|nr:ATP-binding protein [Akkermansia sp.]
MLWSDIESGESEVLEFKRELPSKDKKVMKTVVAFANCQGGRIIFGVDDKTHEVLGVSENDRARLQEKPGLPTASATAGAPATASDKKLTEQHHRGGIPEFRNECRRIYRRAMPINHTPLTRRMIYLSRIWGRGVI